MLLGTRTEATRPVPSSNGDEDGRFGTARLGGMDLPPIIIPTRLCSRELEWGAGGGEAWEQAGPLFCALGRGRISREDGSQHAECLPG
jgi:hypothetical protein